MAKQKSFAFLTVPAPGNTGFISVSVDGVREIMNLHPRYRAIAAVEYEKAVRDYVGLVYKTIIPKLPEDTGEAILSVKMKIPAEGERMPSGEVVSDLARMPVIEFGRQSGATMPPVKEIEDWALNKLGKPGLGFVIARAISKRGLPRPGNQKSGLNAWQETAEETQDKASEYFLAALDRTLNQL